MTTGFSKAQDAERDAIIDALAEKRAELVEAITKANEAIAAANEAREAYNAEIQEAARFASDFADEIESFIDERSDKWRDGDKGEAYSNWHSEFQSFGPEEVDEFEELAEPGEDVGEALSNLPGSIDNYL